MTGSGQFVEIQGTAEGTPFEDSHLKEMLKLGRKGIGRLLALQRKALGIGKND
jgi:ribonuclease PH